MMEFKIITVDTLKRQTPR